MNSNEPLSDEGFALMGAIFAVHNELRGGSSEEIYQKSIEIELGAREIPFESQRRIPVYYKGRELPVSYIPDLVVHDDIIVELKSVAKLQPEHEAQLMNYMRITRKPVGYPVNLAPIDSVDWRRFILKENLPDQS